MAKISLEQASKEVDEWLDYIDITDVEREECEFNINFLVEMVSKGTLIINEDKTIKHILRRPIEGEFSVTELTYKNRLNESMKERYMKGVSHKDVDGRMNATIAALTGEAKGIIKKLEGSDRKSAMFIGGFF